MPTSYKEKMLAAVGLGEIKGNSFVIFNPAAKREELIQKLEENLAKVENYQKSSSDPSLTSIKSPQASDKSILIEGAPLPPGALAPLIQEQKGLIQDLKELNPQTGILPKIIGQALGVDPSPPVTAASISPQQKAEICGAK